ncbi:thioredoxin family protein [Polaribacter sp. Asnod6-C07]|uniref:thioredoxin family protein n=1 Tax=Polaribacter sp. Asnod6-C07 TaxID=3160582 RepID=UPI0038685FA1
MKSKVLIIIFFFGCFALKAQHSEIKPKEYSFSEVESLQKNDPKPLFIFIYTDWCKICEGMKKTTFKNNEVISLLNNQFYFIKLNGEEKNDITFLGKTFFYKPSGNKTGTNQLAKELAFIGGKISYPTTTILNSKFEIDIQVDSFINSKKMKKILENYLNH